MNEREQDWSDWDRWVEAHIARALEDQPFTSTQMEAIGFALSEIRHQLRKEFATEIVKLRTEMNIHLGIAKGNIANIKDDADAAA
jgi:hypothetical protein